MDARRGAADSFQRAGMDAEAAVECLALAGHLTSLLRFESALDAVRESGRLAERATRHDLRSRALALEGNILSMSGDSRRGRETVQAALSLAFEHDLTDAASEAYRRMGSVLEYASDYAGARDVYVGAVDYCRRQGADQQAQLCLSCMSWVLLRTGEWKRALDLCREVTTSDDAPAGSRAAALGITGLIRLYRGENKRSRRCFETSLGLARHAEAVAIELIVLGGLAETCIVDGDDATAQEYFRQLLGRWGDTQDTHDALYPLVSGAAFFAGRGQEGEATACVEALSRVTRITALAESHGVLALAHGELAFARGDYLDAAAHFEQALAHLEQCEVPFEQARAGYRAGAALVAGGRRADGIRRLHVAYRIARRLGARPLGAAIADVLEEVGESAERRSGEKAGRASGLTRRQVEVMRLIAAGLTNKEIAHKLYLSPRTVDMHVGNILDRLDCRSRSEAVHKAGELGLLS